MEHKLIGYYRVSTAKRGASGLGLEGQEAAVAEDEAKRISERTKAALAAYKARGGVLGTARPGAYRLSGGRNLEASRRAGVAAKANAADAYADLAPAIVAMRTEENLSLRAIAGRLNVDGHTTRHGKE